MIKIPAALYLGLVFFTTVAILGGCDSKEPQVAVEPEPAIKEIAPIIALTAVDGARIEAADAAPGEWLSHG